ncbi:MAG: TIGR04282 family arsenosugar biosynthesis glycosyltransferase [Candidatus Omnitrophica bacterium]|nr:TIGR04282 family arsenosugar biosynthesis glycosyltransferase [Candidatus Omnitrophota bacterium]
MKDCLIVFAKEPQGGEVKTRLQSDLSQDTCVKLYKAFLKDTFKLVRAIQCFDMVLAYESSVSEPRYLKTIARDFIFYKQKGRDLGEKMYDAFKYAKGLNYEKVIIIGSDSPNLPAMYIKDAFKQLDENDIVLGPSYDGGYYLIGLKEPCLEIFKRVQWSSKTTLEDTVKNARRLEKKAAFLNTWYDVDDLSGLSRLTRDLMKNKQAALWTRKALKI